MYVYLMRLHNSRFCKIGVASDPEKRLSSIQTANPFLIELVTAVNVKDAQQCERKLHGLFAKNRYRGEWFRLDDDDIDAAKTYLSLAGKGMPQGGVAEATRAELDRLAEGPDPECNSEGICWNDIHRQRNIDTRRRK